MIANPLIFTDAGAKVRTRLIGPENLVREGRQELKTSFHSLSAMTVASSSPLRDRNGDWVSGDLREKELSQHTPSMQPGKGPASWRCQGQAGILLQQPQASTVTITS
jgi:hypothetical protein